MQNVTVKLKPGLWRP